MPRPKSKPLSPEEKEHNKQRSNLEYLCNGVLSAWSFNGVRTWDGLFKRLGYDSRYIESNFSLEHRKKEVSYPELKAYLETLKKDFEDKWIKNHLPTPLTEDNIKPVASVAEEIILSHEPRSGGHFEPVKEIKEDEQIHDRSKEYSKSNTTATSIQTGSRETGEAISKTVSLAVVSPSISSKSEQEFKLEPEPIKKDKEETLTSSNNYGLVPSPYERAFLYWFQKKAAKEALVKITDEKRPAVLIIGGTGVGKTFIIGAIARRLIDSSFEENKTFSHIPYLYIGKTTILVQVGRTFSDKFSITQENMEIVNIEALRSRAGKFWIKCETKIVDGEECEVYKWKFNVQPVVIFFDESQGAKNKGSKAHKIICAYSELPRNNTLVCVSATPFSRVSEAKYFAIATHRPLDHLGFPVGTVLNASNWSSYAAAISDPASPDDFNEASVERLMKDLEDYVVRVKGIKPQFQAINKIQPVDFLSREERDYYYDTEKRLMEEKAKYAQALDMGATPDVHIFTILLKYAMAAEFCKVKLFANRAMEKIKAGKAAVLACKFKQTIIHVVMELEKMGLSRNEMSLIWGGGQTQLTAKQKAKAKILQMQSKLEEQGQNIDDIIEAMELDKIEDREILNLPEHLRLGQQSLEERQVEIDKFQRGETLFCAYTYKAGGVGLSLPHTDEFTSIKCRRKDSGYVYEEDIPLVPTRPRSVDIATTYNPVELAQGVGRCPRIVSLSDTEQFYIFYPNTIEGEIAQVVSVKLRCLSKVVKMPENWMELILNPDNKAKFITSTADLPDDKPEDVAGGLDSASDSNEEE